MSARSPEVGAAPWHVAIVCAADGLRFLALDPSPLVVSTRLAGYVREQAPRTLWPDDASQVHRLLSAGMPDAAIERY